MENRAELKAMVETGTASGWEAALALLDVEKEMQRHKDQARTVRQVLDNSRRGRRAGPL